MTDPPFVPTDFAPPTALVSDHFRLEPLGPQHNEADHAAWTSSIADVRSTPGFPDGNWPPPEGMSLDRNLDDLRRDAADFAARTGFTFTVLEPVTGDVIGCVYLYPSESPDADVTVQSWVRASHAKLDVPLADAVAAWLADEWPWSACTAPAAEPPNWAGDPCLPPTDTNEATTNAPGWGTPRIRRFAIAIDMPLRVRCGDDGRVVRAACSGALQLASGVTPSAAPR